uniref:TRUD domain-containing protein n=1 Tax=Panagrolaimus sp. JU765 TaxID=591449 RepID=A0AC34QWJ7_9BILA
MTVDNNSIKFKKFFSDFIVIEKHGTNLCGSWNKNDLKPFVVEESIVEQPKFLTEDDLKALDDVAAFKTKKHVIKMEGDLNTKENRKALHLFIRQRFDNKLASSSTDTGIDVSLSSMKNKDKREIWPKNVGQFLHFTLKKTGHEGSYALNALARSIGLVNSRIFNFAGSKDRRAVTYQRVSVFKMHPQKLLEGLAKQSNLDIELSEFSYEENQVRFGAHDGNVFYILLRDAEIDVEKFNNVKNCGCLNLFGPQRFGSLKVNTADIGLMILKGDYKSAVEILLDQENVVNPQMKDLLKQYAESKLPSVLKNFPKKIETSNEAILIRSLAKFNGQTDCYFVSLQQMPMRNRSLYLHAYQSKIFNEFAEIYRSKYGIEACADVEVPLPCSKVCETDGEVFEIYNQLLAKDGLTLASFQPLEEAFGMHLTKRKLILMPEDMSYKVIHHSDPDARMIYYPPPEKEPDYGSGHQSVLLVFTLPSGGYATTVLYDIYGQHFKAGDFQDSEE